jgi:transposase InsO family protein
VVEERVRFVLAYLEGQYSLAELCRAYSVSRKTAYKFLTRYVAGGIEALRDRSRAPRHHPNAVAPGVVELVVDTRRHHPSWGPRKLLPYLARQYPGLQLPAPSTVSALLRVRGLAARRRVRPQGLPRSAPFGTVAGPNDLWTADFKGWFRAGNGERCDALTIADTASRFAFACELLERVTVDAARPVFERAFREYGLPHAVRTDNGTPFASRGLGGLTRLSAWWIRLGVRPERITPGKPQQNGRHERFHRTLRDTALRPPAPTRRAQQRVCDAFLHEYNYERPHAALANATPAELYDRSPRPYPSRLPLIQYPSDYTVRRVQCRGHIRWHGDGIFVSETLIGEAIGLCPMRDDGWTIYFGPLALAYFDGRKRQLLPYTTPQWVDAYPPAGSGTEV